MATAVMTARIVKGAEGTEGRLRLIPIELTFTAVGDTYATGGFVLDPKACGLLEVLGFFEVSFALTTGAAQTGSWLTSYDHVNKTVQLFTANGTPTSATALVEAANTVVVGTFVIRAIVFGRG